MSDEKTYRICIEGDEFEMKRQLAVNDAFCALDSIKQSVRRLWKYEDLSSKDANVVIDDLYREICNILDDNYLRELV